ncbi:hypothetical protein NJO91_19430 [Streptomyces microflavus]|uniref:hypothetical protein n=1 Tax=Streptomyces microflavus TaxID=1919 RepID=UPI0029ACC819|nr:hypothetical protein [Streptomyces microflavus]MDX2405284.1 hypothetical protein [Streptomyces microflavus]
MTTLIDTKNEMKRPIDERDGRVSELGRARKAFAGEIGELRDDGLADPEASLQETRASARAMLSAR